MSDDFVEIQNFSKYKINLKGQIMSFKRKKAIIISPKTDKDGYLEACIFNDQNIRKYIRVHRLVYMVFVGEIPKEYQINHIDGVKNNNDLSNLELVTCHENIMHSRNILQRKTRGVVWYSSKNKWMVTIYINRKATHLGYFSNKQDAESAYFNKYLGVYGVEPWGINEK